MRAPRLLKVKMALAVSTLVHSSRPSTDEASKPYLAFIAAACAAESAVAVSGSEAAACDACARLMLSSRRASTRWSES